MMKSSKLKLYIQIFKKRSTSTFNKGILEPLSCFHFFRLKYYFLVPFGITNQTTNTSSVEYVIT